MAKQKEPVVAGAAELKNAKQELFCWLYSGHHNRELFGNGTATYLHAYGGQKEIEELQIKIDGLLNDREKGYTVQKTKYESRIKSVRNGARACAATLLANTSVRARCDFLLDQFISHSFADRELMYVVAQRGDLQSKVMAIREYNRVKARVKGDDDAPATKVLVEFSWESPEPKAKGKVLVPAK